MSHYRNVGWLFFLLGVIAACAAAWWGTKTIRQALTLRYSTTQGVVLDSYATVHRSKNQVSHTAHVLYEYTVAGQTRTSERFSHAYDGPEEYGKDWVQAHQAGSAITVYYDPANPEQSVLRQGLMWRDPIAFGVSLDSLFLTVGIVAWLRSKVRNANEAGGLPVYQLDDSRMAVSLTSTAASMIGGAVGGAVALTGTLSVGFMAPRSLGITLGAQACVVVLSMLVAAGVSSVARSSRRREGKLLVIDQAAQTLTIPATDSGGPPRTYRFEDIYAFGHEKVKSQRGRNTYVHEYVMMSAREHDALVRVQVYPLSTDLEAASLSRWLAESVGIRGGPEATHAMAA